jgi:hypothetical protein
MEKAGDSGAQTERLGGAGCGSGKSLGWKPSIIQCEAGEEKVPKK